MSRTPAAELARLKVQYPRYRIERGELEGLPGAFYAWPRYGTADAVRAVTIADLERKLLAQEGAARSRVPLPRPNRSKDDDMTWGIIHADGHEDVSDLVTTRQSARDWAEELNEDCDCGGQHRMFSREATRGPGRRARRPPALSPPASVP